MTALKGGIQSFYACDRHTWREWLHKNHRSPGRVWLIIYKKESATSSVYYAEAVEEALCFGWIDSKATKGDEESYYRQETVFVMTEFDPMLTIVLISTHSLKM